MTLFFREFSIGAQSPHDKDLATKESLSKSGDVVSRGPPLSREHRHKNTYDSPTSNNLSDQPLNEKQDNLEWTNPI